jgi:hypothetical protein
MEALPTVVFIRGCPRSGTTLMANLLNENPEIGCIAEQPLGDLAERLLPIFWYEDAIEREQQAVTRRRHAAPAVSYEPADSLAEMRALHPYPTRDRLAQILTAVVEAALDKRDLRIIGSKTPGHWSDAQLQLVRASFSDVRSLFMVRAPLATINSMINRRNKARAGMDASWPNQSIDEAIARYQEATCLLLSCAQQDPSRCYVVGYEELRTEPQGVLSALGEYLGVAIVDRFGNIAQPSRAVNVLTEDESRRVRAAFGAAEDAWPVKRLTGPASRLGSALDDCLRVIEPRRTYRCDAPVGDRGLLGTGWSGSEARGICSDSPTAHLFFRVPRAGNYRLHLDVAVEGRWREQRWIGLSLGGQRFECALRGSNTRVSSPAVDLLANGAQHVALDLGALRLCLRRIRFDAA